MPARFDAIGIVVKDMSASLSFYRLLGLEFAADSADEAHSEAQTPGGVRVMFDTVELMRQISPEWQPATGGPAITLAFACASREDVDATTALVAQAGHRIVREPWDAFWGQRYATVADPDGNHVDLFA